LIFYLNFLGGSWNFHEAGHGKGIPDGIGGSIKRSADAKVGYGAEIMDAASFVKELNKILRKMSEFCLFVQLCSIQYIEIFVVMKHQSASIEFLSTFWHCNFRKNLHV
jgi:hypothetical protein